MKGRKASKRKNERGEGEEIKALALLSLLKDSGTLRCPFSYRMVLSLVPSTSFLREQQEPIKAEEG